MKARIFRIIIVTCIGMIICFSLSSGVHAKGPGTTFGNGFIQNEIPMENRIWGAGAGDHDIANADILNGFAKSILFESSGIPYDVYKLNSDIFLTDYNNYMAIPISINDYPESFYLHDAQGNRIVTNCNAYLANPSNPDWRREVMSWAIYKAEMNNADIFFDVARHDFQYEWVYGKEPVEITPEQWTTMHRQMLDYTSQIAAQYGRGIVFNGLKTKKEAKTLAALPLLLGAMGETVFYHNTGQNYSPKASTLTMDLAFTLQDEQKQISWVIKKEGLMNDPKVINYIYALYEICHKGNLVLTFVDFLNGKRGNDEFYAPYLFGHILGALQDSEIRRIDDIRLIKREYGLAAANIGKEEAILYLENDRNLQLDVVYFEGSCILENNVCKEPTDFVVKRTPLEQSEHYMGDGVYRLGPHEGVILIHRDKEIVPKAVTELNISVIER